MRQKQLWELFFETGAPEYYVMSKHPNEKKETEKEQPKP